MPHVIVKLLAGRSEEQKSRLAAQLAKDVTAILNCGEDSISVAIEDIKAGDCPSVTRKEKGGPPGEISLLGFCTIRTATPLFTSDRTNNGNTSRQATARNSNSER